MKYLFPFLAFLLVCTGGCNNNLPDSALHPENAFTNFESDFLDQYWKQYPASSIFIGYGKYYDLLAIPDSGTFQSNIQFSRLWLDSLKKIDYNRLSDNNKISYEIIQNQLQSDSWYTSVFKSQEWDASLYNLSNESYYLIHQPYAPLDSRLRILTKHLQNADAYYRAAFNMLKRPTRESVELAIEQNKGGLSIFGADLNDSIKASHLTGEEIGMLNQNVKKTVGSINRFIDSLKHIAANKNYVFRKYSIGKSHYAEKFKYDLATNFSPEEIYEKALDEKKIVTHRMFLTAGSLWPKYNAGKPKPADSMALIQAVIDAVSLQHAKGKDFFDSLKSQVYQLKRFIIEKDLFSFDTTYPIIVRLMPDYERGVALASAEFTPPYQKQGDTYYNIDDVTRFSAEKMESTLREMNNYTSQLISIHEAVPGHCLQGIYNNKKSPDVLRSVFQNGAMVEGWAVYTEYMMLENGWGNFTPEISIMHDKLILRELGNVLIDYRMQCLEYSREAIMQLLTRELFQSTAQAEEKYHRATLSQVQLCSYYAGASAILYLRSDYKAKLGDKFTLKTFHDNFLGYGSSPVKYIRERMMQ